MVAIEDGSLRSALRAQALHVWLRTLATTALAAAVLLLL